MNKMTRFMALRNSPEFENYHPHYFMALFSAPATAAWNEGNSGHGDSGDWEIPAIDFATEEWTRRSMALNGMRMSTEYFAHGSPRVLALIAQRLQSGQSDVVHDLLVYLWERVLQVRAEMDEARTVQAESLAAYLGVPPQPVIELLSAPELSASEIQQQISAGFAGAPRRALDITVLVENILARLQPELENLRTRENHILQLIDDIVARLYGAGN